MRQILLKLRSVYLKNYIRKYEKNWDVEGVSLKYLLEKHHSRRIVVVFSGFSGHHVKGKYNYIRTLSCIKDNKLFILDDFGYENVGSYYLGNHCSLYDNGGVISLIKHCIDKTKAEEIVFLGSSKGGSAALYYGLKMGANVIICGSPQYNIGDYLHENDYHKSIFNEIVSGEKNRAWLNNLIRNEIKTSNGVEKIFLMYSSKEESYEQDISKLLIDLNEAHLDVETTDVKYENHSEIAKFFPGYIRELLAKKNL